MQQGNRQRRGFFKWAALLGLGFGAGSARAHHTDTHFEDSSEHRIVYQCNKADPDYFAHILFSVGELIRKHGDNAIAQL